MNLSQWLCIAVFILSALSVAVFRNLGGLNSQSVDWCKTYEPPALLCGQKIALKKARVDELALIDGISLKSARRIVSFVALANNNLSVEDLLIIRGIGAKTVEKLKNYFY